MKTNIKILITILTILFISCTPQHKELKVHKLKDGRGYCYQNENDLLWYLLVYNQLTGTYDLQQTSTVPSYQETTQTFEASQETVSNYEQSEITETTGEDVGGSETESNDTPTDTDSGMSESSGSDSGGNDSGGDSGGGE